jgi:hypothetical protein
MLKFLHLIGRPEFTDHQGVLMKFVKMSLAAAMLMGASAFAIENVKVDGAASLFYTTTDDGSATADLFDKGSASGQAALKLGATADLTKGVSAGATLYAISTLGLEGTLVSDVWEMGTDDEYWFGEAWLAGTTGKTTAKVGRMELDTPLVFSEGWSIAPNTFDAAVVVNQDIEKTTLVGAYVGKHNAGGTTTGAGGILNEIDAVTDTAFNKFYDGAYAFGAVTTAIPMTTAQLWYYDAQSTATAYWAQADVAIDGGVSFGAQFAGMEPATAGADDSEAFALKVGYDMPDVVSVAVAYSSVDEDGTMGIRNLSTDFESRLYTEKWWNFGLVGDQGADSYSLTASTTAGGVDLFAGYYVTEVDLVGTASDYEFTEFTVTAGKSFGALDATLVYIMGDDDQDGTVNDVDSDTVQVYLTYNF